MFPSSIDVYDILANIAGFVPVGFVLADLGPVWAVMAAALLSAARRNQPACDGIPNPFPDRCCDQRPRGNPGSDCSCSLQHKTPIHGHQTDWSSCRCAFLVADSRRLDDVRQLARDRATTTPGTGTLEAHWTFDESGGRIALDSSGHGLNGEYHNEPKRVAGPIGNAVKFDGTTDYIDFGHPTALRLTSSMTISAWIKSTSYPRDDAAIVSSHNGVGFQLDTTIDRGPRTIGFKLGNSCGLMMARYGKTPLALNTWYYVAGVYNAKAKTMDVYLNGELDNGFLLGPVMGHSKKPPDRMYTSGSEATMIKYGFAGEIGDARIYSLPLTKAEIVGGYAWFRA